MDTTRPRTALVTGASAGLGLALARTLAADGWRLVNTARGRAALATAQAQLALRTPTTMVVGDVADPAHRGAVADAVAETVGEAGHLDLVVNNASDLGPPASEWLPGTTAQVAFGQGAVVSNAFEMGLVAATIANDGERMKPRLVKDVERDARVLLGRLNGGLRRALGEGGPDAGQHRRRGRGGHERPSGDLECHSVLLP